MGQLLVRKVDSATVRQLKARAKALGISVEEAHRRLLREALNRPSGSRPTLIQFLRETEVAPDVDLDLERSGKLEERDIGM